MRNFIVRIVTPQLLAVGPRFHIIGAGRGGTSLLASLLNMHPSIDVGFELYAQEILMNPRISHDEIDPLQNRFSSYLAACDVISSESVACGRLWGNKITTEHIFAAISESGCSSRITHSLDRVFNEFLGDELIIFILRDGRNCVSSKMNRAGLSLEEACDRWLFSVRCWQCLERCTANALIIRFEHLVADPVRVLETICNRINIAYDPLMLDGTSSEHLLPEYRQNGFDLTRLKQISLPPSGFDRIRSSLLLAGYPE